jgi:hypothetical protein
MGAWHDVGWMQLDLVPEPPTPSGPTPLAELLADPAQVRALEAILGNG